MNSSRSIRLSLGLAALSCSCWGTQASAAVQDYEGSYEALLISGSGLSALPAGKLTVKIAKAGTFSGTLIASDAGSYPLSGKIEEVEGVARLVPPKGSVLRELQVKRGKNIPNYTVSFSINDGVLSANLSTTGLSAMADDGVKLKVFAKGEAAADWAGSYTVALAAPEKLPGAIDTAIPSGTGYALATVDAKGLLKYTGKLADGTVISGSLSSASNRDYRLFINPYKTANSFFGGDVSFSAREEGGFGGAPETELFWRKSPASKPKVFIAGFGPLGVATTMERWTAPAKGVTLVDSLGIEGKQFSFDVFGDTELATLYPGKLPVRLKLDASGKLLPVFGDSLAPNTDKLWSKIWSAKVDPKTGKFTATLKVKDFITKPKAAGGSDGDRWVAAKIVERVIKFEGVLLRAFQSPENPFDMIGYFELPAVTGVSDATYGGVDGGDDFAEVGVGAPAPDTIAPGTPGNYRFTVETVADVTLANIPTDQAGFSLISQDSVPTPFTDGGTLNFNISADLTVLTFNGRRIPLAGDGRTRGATTPGPLAGGNLVYADTTKPGAKTPKRDNIVVVFYLNESGVVTGVQVSNIFILPAKWRIKLPAMTVTVPKVGTITTPAQNRVVSAFSVAFYTYTDLTDPVKIP